MAYSSARMLLKMPAMTREALRSVSPRSALAAPAHHCPDDHVAGDLVPVRGHAADDGVVVRVARGVGLAVEQAADERVEGQVDGVRRPPARPVRGARPEMRLRWYGQPLGRAGHLDDERRGGIQVDRVGLDQLGLALDVAVQHAASRAADAGHVLEANALASSSPTYESLRENSSPLTSLDRLWRDRPAGALLPLPKSGTVAPF